MASCSRAHAIKAALVLGFLLILLNLIASRLDSTPIGLPRMGTTQWPKRTRSSSERLAHTHLEPHGERHNDSSHNASNKTSRTDTLADQSVTISKNSTLQKINFSDSKTNLNINDTKSLLNLIETALPTIWVTPSVDATLQGQPGGSNPVPSANPVNGSSINISSNNLTSIDTNGKNLIEPSLSSNSKDGRTSSNSEHVSAVEQQSVNEAEENFSAIDSYMRKNGQSNCPPIPPNLDGPIEVDVSYESLSSVERKLAPKLQPGGQYTPRECSARDRVAIIVPYRDRDQHLPVFLKNLHPLLMKQQIEYGVYIVEQSAGTSFNRASLMNIGFVEAMKQKNWDCMVFHDVDLLPMDDRNLYTCPDQPRHMSVAVDTFGFKLPYNTIFGGVSAMTVKQFRTVNGFSNAFWGWGGEDDDMSNRLKHVGFHIARYPINIARYTMLSHKKEKANPKRYEKLVTGAKRFDSDGLNSLHYQLINLFRKPLFTWVHVEISADSS
ncbi:beta-1,4-N-acetylgalactosaminyltransferase bre-4 [Wyeomyia smithii]|uniref:beta-1,4-N-acetylgalactosaminyltransferase bre-4 n=1 Tax=Wyeomyia smithii TaxID=174621 RepID=UPI002467F6C7|nr:beta-1,4-N-acetylgalactosaminyltransferase bre-4 [Wyeomyia smithii]XP_055533808.1 beta-1,4-N-acetylgalactosaminyltransferase bre-4 [Wyeomyia smithii]XP_055533809.1 beta-1,4-N-acetylgalactosaminyltransferase bre-4 [Wyeomyia smithii]XP_055533810.1 beta-1,4-N-acetylgalactosaminyltransferase bre-4 [Wyeomyia smithii]XP_055533811.1 beta-1,4-N-acetylgalactosaminyltransferase bre-4 [Wyeomyia smithii]